MQLKGGRQAGLVAALSVMTATLLSGGIALAKDDAAAPSGSGLGLDSDTSSDVGLTRVDAAVLIYQEDAGRVRAIEPTIGVTYNGQSGRVLSLHWLSDTLSGATPNGTTPWSSTQTLLSPVSIAGSGTTTTTVAGGSGGGDDGKNGQVRTQASSGGVATTTRASGTVTAVAGSSSLGIQQSTIPANVLPVSAFHDKRTGGNLSFTTPLGERTRLSIGGGYSAETDYSSYNGDLSLSRDFNQKNTTLVLDFNFEHDVSSPQFGNPTPLSLMSGAVKGGDQTKDIYGGMVGFTQVINRHWLAQFNYTVSQGDGYQNDPYRLIASVNRISGAPVNYYYEARPTTRLRQSVYFGNKIALGQTVADISARGYSDDWGVHSFTLQASERIPLTHRLFVEPGGRFYTQSAADFYRPYLLSGDAMPKFASADSRLAKFNAATGSLRVGLRVGDYGELYAQVDRYHQAGAKVTGGAGGYLTGKSLFSGVDATSSIVGYSFAFK